MRVPWNARIYVLYLKVTKEGSRTGPGVYKHESKKDIGKDSRGLQRWTTPTRDTAWWHRKTDAPSDLYASDLSLHPSRKSCGGRDSQLWPLPEDGDVIVTLLSPSFVPYYLIQSFLVHAQAQARARTHTHTPSYQRAVAAEHACLALTLWLPRPTRCRVWRSQTTHTSTSLTRAGLRREEGCVPGGRWAAANNTGGQNLRPFNEIKCHTKY